LDDRVSTVVWIRQVVATIAAAGLDGDALCRRAGLEPRALEAADARLPNAVIGKLWALAVEESGNPAIALLARPAFKPAALDAMGYAMMSSPDLRGALERAVRYAAIMSNATTGRLIPVRDGLRFEVITRDGSAPSPVQGAEFVLLTLLTFLRWIAGQALTPVAVEFQHGVPADLKPYEEAFRCPLAFGASSYAIVFNRADLAAPLHTANPWLAQVHDRLVAERIDQIERAPHGALSVTRRARQLIVQSLPDGEPTRRAVAAALGLSERTLQRRLHDEGSSYHGLLDGSRRELAERYLASDSVALVEAASLLGFSGQASFTRACRRWFGASPLKVRSRLGDVI
jgi:AraC-like DNA-binding protein